MHCVRVPLYKNIIRVYRYIRAYILIYEPVANRAFVR